MKIAIALIVVLSCLMPVRADAQDQNQNRDGSTRSVTKIVIGAGALAIGVAVAAKSSQTTTVSTNLGTSETSTFSTTQLVTGLAVAGVGGIVLWDGLRSHDTTHPSTTIGAVVGPRVHSVLVRHSW